MLKKLKQSLAHLREGPPGRRFMNRYHSHRQERPSVALAFVGLGALLLVLGLIFSLVPGIAGIPFALLGIALIVARVRSVALALDRGELAVRRWWSRWCR